MLGKWLIVTVAYGNSFPTREQQQELRGKLKLGLIEISRLCFHFQERKKKSFLETIGLYLTSYLTGGRKDVQILLTGKTGVGKSSLVNALIGQEIAPEGHTLKPETTEVSYWRSIGLKIYC